MLLSDTWLSHKELLTEKTDLIFKNFSKNEFLDCLSELVGRTKSSDLFEQLKEEGSIIEVRVHEYTFHYEVKEDVRNSRTALHSLCIFADALIFNIFSFILFLLRFAWYRRTYLYEISSVSVLVGSIYLSWSLESSEAKPLFALLFIVGAAMCCCIVPMRESRKEKRQSFKTHDFERAVKWNRKDFV